MCSCGTLPFVFEEGFGFERYVEYVLDVPMYFVYRNGTYHDVSGQSFRDFMHGKLPGLPGEAGLTAGVDACLAALLPCSSLHLHLPHAPTPPQASCPLSRTGRPT